MIFRLSYIYRRNIGDNNSQASNLVFDAHILCALH